MDSETPGIDQEISALHELAARNRRAQMRPLLERLLPQYPDHHDLLYYAALVDWQDDKDEEALKTISQLVQLHPESFGGRILLFRILDGLNRSAEAEGVILELMREYPEEAMLFGRYSLLMLETMQVEKAGELASRGLQLDPDDEMSLTASVLYELVANPGEAAQHRLAELVQRYPDSVGTASMVIAVLSDQGRTTEALRIAQEVLRQSPDSEGLVNTVVVLKSASHWSVIPMRPFQKWGWGASIGLWFAVMFLMRSARGTTWEAYTTPVAIVFLAFVVYSWVWPPLLKRLIRR